MKSSSYRVSKSRHAVLLGVFVIASSVLMVRLFDLQLNKGTFLKDVGQETHLRLVELAAHRGVVLDRNNEVLAMSTPVDSICANPSELQYQEFALPALAKAIGWPLDHLRREVHKRSNKAFMYLSRHASQTKVDQVKALEIPGVFFKREYRRYYPSAEVMAHVVGFTNIDDIGQEGLEGTYDNWLRGSAGSKWVLKDNLGRTIEDVDYVKAPQPGKQLTLSLDRQIQYLAYRSLKAAVKKHGAESGSIVVLNNKTGEILAMANQPAFNPNNRAQLKSERYRNRAVTDLVEPGSTIKPFVVAAALSSGAMQSKAAFNTSPGQYRLQGRLINDIKDYGRLDIEAILVKSSNVGMSKIALQTEAKSIWSMLDQLGFGISTNSGFQGESFGNLPHHTDWSEVDQAVLSFGYGLSVTPLQLAKAYATLANDGVAVPVTFLKKTDAEQGKRIVPQSVAREVRRMLEGVVSDEGTARLAKVDGYRVAGKTGTVRIAGKQGYDEDRYLTLFAGMIPASNPQLVAVVTVSDPRGEEYYGGIVAAPVFAEVMKSAVRVLDIHPDDLGSVRHVNRQGEMSGKAVDARYQY